MYSQESNSPVSSLVDVRIEKPPPSYASVLRKDSRELPTYYQVSHL